MSKKDAWLIIYAGLISIKHHPRNEHPPSMEELAKLTDKAMDEISKRFPLWHG